MLHFILELAQYLIDYTQKQCLLWNIPLISEVPLSHVFNFNTLTWYDGYFDLPISPIDNSPILLVPRRIVRVFPWINYDDFFKMEFSNYLRAKRVKGRLATKKIAPAQIKKEEKEKVVSLNRTEIERIDRYVLAKEKAYEQAQPSLNYIDASKISIVAEELKEKLNQVKTGREDAGKY
ncbi:hypothetical protein VB774_02420 [Pseudanabaena galeata UHCC 0370]|uniref:Uncharacterized protein n=1 Tax=Pseudanabaena galeata UHCC 0370 TaxID=3110310 RepID=A0ABU5TEI2_9CYAN|nr:hypothetical protein [Pseudanabaena galeata]MEA5476463.1 hypothetical protein [Pseudanabaena galeata UHCC 0370]